MKKLLALLLIGLSVAPAAFAGDDVYVNGYTKSNGTYVQPHYRSAPDGIESNNKSYRGY